MLDGMQKKIICSSFSISFSILIFTHVTFCLGVQTFRSTLECLGLNKVCVAAPPLFKMPSNRVMLRLRMTVLVNVVTKAKPRRAESFRRLRQ